MKKLSLLVAVSMAVVVCSTSLAERIEDTTGFDLTDLTAPNGQSPTKSISASSTHSDQYNHYKLFDNLCDGDNTRCMLAKQQNPNIAYVTYEFDSPQIVNGFGFKTATFSGGDRAPKSWRLIASTDGEKWTEIDAESETEAWSGNTWRYYKYENKTSYTHYRFEFFETFTSSQGWYQLSEIELYNFMPTQLLIVESTTREVGSVSPAYGEGKVPVGETQAFSAFDSWTSQGEDERAICNGYVLYQQIGDDQWEVLKQGESSTFVLDDVPDMPLRLAWDIDYSAKVSILPAENGGTTGAGWYAFGEMATLMATPAAGYEVRGWYNGKTGEGSEVNPWSFEVQGPISVMPQFVESGLVARYVSMTGDDANNGLTLATAFKTIAKAVADLGEDGGTVFVATGDYVELKNEDSSIKEAIRVESPVKIVGMSGSPNDVKIGISAGGSRIFTLNHADASLRFLTIKGGKVNQGGNVKIESNGGVVEDCILENGQNSDYSGGGGNLWMANGRVSRCVIRNGTGQSNNYGSNGGGFWMSGGVLEDCLVTKNTGRYPGGVVSGTAKVINCTIVDNSYDIAGCGAVSVPTKDADAAKVAVVNTIISGNHNSKGTSMSDLVFNGNASCFVNCASAEGLINDSCRTGDMGFADVESGDYSLSVSSQLRDQGAETSAYGSVSTTDLTGRSRKIGSAIDIGAYEFELNGMVGDFTIASASYIVPAVITLTATVEGAKGVVEYKWEMDDGVAEHHVTQVTTDAAYDWICAYAGHYTVKLTASSGDDQIEVEHTVQTAPKTLYVVNGNEQKNYPYDSEATGSATIAEAVDAAMDGSVIYVLPTATPFAEPEISVVKNVSILGKSGNPADVKVESTQGRAFNVNASGALLANMTMQGKSHNGNGGSLLIDGAGGVVSNCVLCCTTVQSWTSGGAGVSCAYGCVTHCVISGFGGISTGDASNNGIAARLRNGARLENSLITNVTSTIDRSGGFIVSAVGSTVRNCTIVDCKVPKVIFDTKNGVPYGAPGAGLLAESQSTIENCVVVNVRREDDDVLAPWGGTSANFANCATDGDAAINESCKLITSAAFKDYAKGDYTPAAGGALVDAGVTPTGWDKLTDLAGKKRVVGSAIDIGAYELQAPSQPKGVLIIYH